MEDLKPSDQDAEKQNDRIITKSDLRLFCIFIAVTMILDLVVLAIVLI